MRTTVNIEDDVLQAVKYIAQTESKSLGDVISSLLRKCLAGTNEERYTGDVPVFHVSENAKPLTLEDVKKNEDE